MDSNNWREQRRMEREKWREQRRQWKTDRHRMWEDRRSEAMENWSGRYQSGHGHIWTGLFLLLIGIDYFLAENRLVPQWMFSWEMFLIGMGFFLGARHAFRGVAWLILILLGGVFLVKHHFAAYFPEINFDNLWPIALIVMGLFFIFRPRRRFRKKYSEEISNKTIGQETEPAATAAAPAPEDFIDSTSIFGGIKKNVISKNFRGGDITNIMGGSEIDLTQADINGTVTIDLTQIFGGTKLIVPSNWQVKPQMAAIFGGVEDKRSARNAAPDPNKILVLDGTSIFGGIEIRSY
jgi:predicted membrane protein